MAVASVNLDWFSEPGLVVILSQCLLSLPIPLCRLTSGSLAANHQFDQLLVCLVLAVDCSMLDRTEREQSPVGFAGPTWPPGPACTPLCLKSLVPGGLFFGVHFCEGNSSGLPRVLNKG